MSDNQLSDTTCELVEEINVFVTQFSKYNGSQRLRGSRISKKISLVGSKLHAGELTFKMFDRGSVKATFDKVRQFQRPFDKFR
jgi:hypothetical protein